jgi:MoxR-like ATPase
MSADDQLVEKVAEAYRDLTESIGRKIVGQRDVVEQLVIALLARGHALIVGVPGLAKTSMVKALSRTLSLEFGRIQFTPDLMPTDITGTDVLEERRGGERRFRFVEGPIFCNLLLADEINRTPPKTQAALLEGMQERSVTVGGKTYHLEEPFTVLATQNPIEQSGTYPLPEAQLDRFMMQIDVGYPSAEDEVEVIRRTTAPDAAEITSVLERAEVLQLQDLVPRVPAADHVLEYAVRMVRRTRPEDPTAAQDMIPYVAFGAGPRAAQMLVLAAKGRTLLRGRFAVETDDVEAMANAVLRHRIVTSFEAEAEGVPSAEVIRRVVETTPR